MLREARDLVDLGRDRDAVDEVLELQVAADFRDDRVRVRIPARDELARLHGLAVLDAERRAVRDLVALALAAELVDDGELARPRRRDPVALLLVGHGLHVDEAHRTRALHLDAVHRGGPRRGAADVERTHRELRAGLADRLRRDHADGLAAVHAVAASEVASVALRADAVGGLARDRGADEQLVDRVRLERLDRALVEQRARLEHDLVGARSEHVDRGRAAQARARAAARRCRRLRRAASSGDPAWCRSRSA